MKFGKYILVFGITAVLFISAFILSSFLNVRKVENLRLLQDSLSLDLLSTEARFALLKESSCDSVSAETLLSQELGTLGERVAYMENQLGSENNDVIQLKKYYTLLESKEYLLIQELSKKCKHILQPILYFYNNEECDDCTKQSYALSGLVEKFPNLRVYTFDVSLDSPIVRTLKQMFRVDTTPTIVFSGVTYEGFQSLEDFTKLLPELAKEKAKQEAAVKTTTKTQ